MLWFILGVVVLFLAIRNARIVGLALLVLVGIGGGLFAVGKLAGWDEKPPVHPTHVDRVLR